MMAMNIILEGEGKGSCVCEKCGCLLPADEVQYATHLDQCDGKDGGASGGGAGRVRDHYPEATGEMEVGETDTEYGGKWSSRDWNV
jgi:hypothetical protein